MATWFELDWVWVCGCVSMWMWESVITSWLGARPVLPDGSCPPFQMQCGCCLIFREVLVEVSPTRKW